MNTRSVRSKTTYSLIKVNKNELNETNEKNENNQTNGTNEKPTKISLKKYLKQGSTNNLKNYSTYNVKTKESNDRELSTKNYSTSFLPYQQRHLTIADKSEKLKLTLKPSKLFKQAKQSKQTKKIKKGNTEKRPSITISQLIMEQKLKTQKGKKGKLII